MDKTKSVRTDKIVALIFFVLTVLFIVLMAINKNFFDWAFLRHQNQLSWYIRPLWLIPFCYFSYKRSLAGIFGTIFLLLTSMFWFPQPAVVGEQIRNFLIMEREYLMGYWGTGKILITMLIPISLTALAFAFWKRSLWFGISVIIFIAIAKMLWSVIFGGESGTSIIVPAVAGLAVCIVFIYLGYKKMGKNKK